MRPVPRVVAAEPDLAPATRRGEGDQQRERADRGIGQAAVCGRCAGESRKNNANLRLSAMRAAFS